MHIDNLYTRWVLALSLLLNVAIPPLPEEDTEELSDDVSASQPVWDLPPFTHVLPVTPASPTAPPIASPAPAPVKVPTPAPLPAPKPAPVPTPVLSQVQRAVNFARAQLGKPYVWGATGPNSYDCSGLTMKSWKAAGVNIPRTSQEQWAELPHISLTHIQVGDLVVYYNGASHVAIYIGNGQIIEALNSSHPIQIASMYHNPILGVVRPG